MSDEFDQRSEDNYSAFWPLCILLVGLLAWSGYQVWATNKQRSLNEQQFQAALPTITEAQNVSTRYVSLMKDLVDTAQKDQAAADIVKAAIAANLIHVQPNSTNGASATPPASK
jgi:cytoskeletal protein RodZ